MVKNPPAMQGSITGLGGFPWRRAWQPTPVFLPGESPCTGKLQSRGHKESDITEQLSTYYFKNIAKTLGILPSTNSSDQVVFQS